MKRSSLTTAPVRRILLGILALPLAALAREVDVDIKATSIEQLMQISVTTVSRQEQDLQGSAAAIFVLSREDIRRAHVTSVPEALRLVPGVQVARIDANKWAVSIRGFNSRTANKLLVLVDGRSVYDPLFAGVFWEARDVNLEEIERIEVVRGPGGTLWGANAVNGVINIITRHTQDTHGAQITAGAGTEERSQAGVRYGWRWNAGTHSRVYADSFSRDTGFAPAGAHDDARMQRAGFRTDLETNTSKLMFKGDVYHGIFGTAVSSGGAQDLGHKGQSVVVRWNYAHSESIQSMLQFWYDRFAFDDINLGEKRDTYDLEFQNTILHGTSHRFVWGGGFRHTADDIRNGSILMISPPSREDNLINLFVQDDISLAERRVRLILGTKIEYSDYSGTEWLPNLRVAWIPNASNTFWSSISRAIRSYSRLESDLVEVPPIIPAGNPALDSEKLWAFEAGYRSRLSSQAWLDTTLFSNFYRNLQSIEGNIIGDKVRGTTAGVEVAGRWLAGPDWKYDVAYTYLIMNLSAEAQSTDIRTPTLTEDGNPRHQLVIRGAWTPAYRIEIDAALRYVDELPAFSVPAYITADFGMTWKPRPGLRLSAVGQNLFDPSHPEQAGSTTSEVQRGFYLKLGWES